jgi:hypothetical protein
MEMEMGIIDMEMKHIQIVNNSPISVASAAGKRGSYCRKRAGAGMESIASLTGSLSLFKLFLCVVCVVALHSTGVLHTGYLFIFFQALCVVYTMMLYCTLLRTFALHFTFYLSSIHLHH